MLDFDSQANMQTAAQLRAAGAAMTKQVKIGKQTKSVLFVPMDQTPKDQVATKPEENSLRAAMADAQQPRFTPRQAMHMVLAQAARDKSLPADVRNGALAWIMKNNSLERAKLSRTADKGMHMKKGQQALARLSPQFMSKIDPEVRQSLGSYAPPEPAPQKNMRPDFSSMLKQIKTPEINANTIQQVSISKLASQLRGKTSRLMQRDVLLKTLGAVVMTASPNGLFLAGVELAMGIAARPAPQVRARNAFALNR